MYQVNPEKKRKEKAEEKKDRGCLDAKKKNEIMIL
jgi:hypothetical protein